MQLKKVTFFSESLGFGRKAIVLVETNLGREIAPKAMQEALYQGANISEETRKNFQQCTIRATTFGKSAHSPNHDDDPLIHVSDYLQTAVTEKRFRRTYLHAYV